VPEPLDKPEPKFQNPEAFPATLTDPLQAETLQHIQEVNSFPQTSRPGFSVLFWKNISLAFFRQQS